VERVRLVSQEKCWAVSGRWLVGGWRWVVAGSLVHSSGFAVAAVAQVGGSEEVEQHAEHHPHHGHQEHVVTALGTLRPHLAGHISEAFTVCTYSLHATKERYEPPHGHAMVPYTGTGVVSVRHLGN